jgi:multimeric flavodoxin WrbA
MTKNHTIKRSETMKKSTGRVLGIVGSPRRGGNTETLVDEVLAGAEEGGAVTTKVILNELNISPCQACNACGKTGICVQKDDMAHVLEYMRNSHTWVLGTPVYWWGPTAQFKAFLDRWYGIKRDIFKGKRIVLVIPSGGSTEYARYTVGILTDVMHYLHAEIVATIRAPGTHGLGSVRNDANLMAAARNAGQKVVNQKYL